MNLKNPDLMGVFYKRSKLRSLESGNFWLSETPETPGSMSWEVCLPRMVTWGLFQILESGRRFYFYNTHFPHRAPDSAAKLECAKVIAGRMRAFPADLPFIMAGDFNAPAGQDVYQLMARGMKRGYAGAHPKMVFRRLPGVSSGVDVSADRAAVVLDFARRGDRG